MNDLVMGLLGAVALAGISFFFGRRSRDRQSSTPPAHNSQLEEIHDEVVEGVTQAGDELADNLADPPDVQHESIMEWLRNRRNRRR